MQSQELVSYKSTDILKPEVFSALSVHDYLKRYFSWKKSESPSFSLRSVARKLSFKSQSHFAMIVRGERLPQPETLKSISELIGHTDREYEYLLSLLLFQKAKSTKEKLRLGVILTKQRSTTDDLVLEVDGLAIFERWYHIAILEMTLMAGFVPDERWIADRLGSTISPNMVQDAIERLLRSGLIERMPDGSLKKINMVTKSRGKITTASMRSYQKQMLQRAAVAIENQPPTERLFMNVMFPLDTADIDRAKDEVASFIESFRLKFSKPGSDSIYYFGGQLFSIARTNKDAGSQQPH